MFFAALGPQYAGHAHRTKANMRSIEASGILTRPTATWIRTVTAVSVTNSPGRYTLTDQWWPPSRPLRVLPMVGRLGSGIVAE